MDLTEERREVIQALLEMDCLPAGMEMFPAADEDQWTLIKQVIDESDYYVVIVGGRYGSLAPDGISYTEKEYDYAVSTGKTVLGFVHENPEELPLKKSQPAAQAELDAFLAKVKTKLVRSYKSPAELGSAVTRSLINAMKRHPAEGWVRGEYALTPETQLELSALRAEVSELKRELEHRNNAQIIVPSDLESGDDIYEIEVLLDYVAANELRLEELMIETAKIYHDKAFIAVTWNDIIGEIGPRMLDEAGERTLLATALSNYARRLLLDSRKDLLPGGFGRANEVGISQQSFDDIMLHLHALNVTTNGTKTRGVADTDKYWVLTEAGRNTLMNLRAIRKQPAKATD
jgi:hypothetical protein